MFLLRPGAARAISILLSILPGALSTVSAAAEADSENADTLRLPDRAARLDPAEARLSAPQSEIVLRPDDWRGRSLTLADLLAEQAGIETRRYGGLGSFQTVSVRGATGARLLVYLDGVPLNSAGGAPVDLGKISLELLERVEIRKGLAPASEGGNGMGGVVHLHSKDGGGSRLSLSAGSHGVQRHALSLGKGGVFANLAFTRADNDFRYRDRNHTPYNPEDDRWAIRENSAFRSVEGHAQARLAMGGNRFRFKMAGSRNAGGLPGREGEVTRTAGFSNALTQYLLGWKRRSEAGELSADLALDEETPEFHWTKDDPIGWSTGRDTTRIENRGARARLDLRGEAALPFAPARVAAAASAGVENLKPVGRDASFNPAFANSRRHVSLAADLNYAPAPAWAFTAGGHAEGRIDRTAGGGTFYGDTLPAGEWADWHPAGRLGLLWKSGAAALFANMGWFYHLPGLTDRFGGRWGMVPNPELRPERGTNAEAGARLRWRGWEGFLEAALFRNQTRDAILYLHSANLIKPVNLDAALAQGLEITWDQNLPAGLGLAYVATWRHTENQSRTFFNGLRLPNEPAYGHRLKGRIPLPARLHLEAVWEFRSDLYRDPGNLQRIPPQHLQHGLVRWEPHRRLEFTFSAQNLGDTYYEDAYSAYPYPGRQFHLAAAAGF